jgi:hypothetical protein
MSRPTRKFIYVSGALSGFISAANSRRGVAGEPTPEGRRHINYSDRLLVKAPFAMILSLAGTPRLLDSIAG